jgi:hypothetical protein
MGKITLASFAQGTKTSEVDLGLKDQLITNVTSFRELSDLALKALIQNGITIIPDASGSTGGVR